MEVKRDGWHNMNGILCMPLANVELQSHRHKNPKSSWSVQNLVGTLRRANHPYCTSGYVVKKGPGEEGSPHPDC